MKVEDIQFQALTNEQIPQWIWIYTESVYNNKIKEVLGNEKLSEEELTLLEHECDATKYELDKIFNFYLKIKDLYKQNKIDIKTLRENLNSIQNYIRMNHSITENYKLWEQQKINEINNYNKTIPDLYDIIMSIRNRKK